MEVEGYWVAQFKTLVRTVRNAGVVMRFFLLCLQFNNVSLDCKAGLAKK